jgi:hypothetical protein
VRSHFEVKVVVEGEPEPAFIDLHPAESVVRVLSKEVAMTSLRPGTCCACWPG